MNWLAQIAPTIATAFGGPLAGMAVSAVSKALGCAPEDRGNFRLLWHPRWLDVRQDRTCSPD
jgi:hypothetical protein